jgi:hypothetical protein
MRVWLAAAVLCAACSDRPPAPRPRDATPGEAPVADTPPPTAPSAAPPADGGPAAPIRTAPADDAFDFRLVPLDGKYIGTDQLCDVLAIERSGDRKAYVTCWNGWAGVPIELTIDSPHAVLASQIERGDRIKVEVVEPGGSSGPFAIASLRAVVGPAPVNTSPMPSVPASPSASFDFARVNREKALDKTVQACKVLSTDRIARVDPKAEKGAAASWLPPDRARFFVRVTCGEAAGGSSRVVLGARSYQPLLELRPDAIVRVSVIHQGRYPQREAMGIFVESAFVPPRPQPW